MIRDRRSFGMGLFLALILWCFFPALAAAAGTPTSRKKSDTVWVVFFSSRDGPRCESAKLLLGNLKTVYPVRAKIFDVTREKDYALFHRLESIHSEGEFAVPLIMAGETILQGEDEIAAKLEKTVKRLSRSGGAGLPYLGQNARTRHVSPSSESRPCPCQEKSRPPTLKEELGKLKVLFDQVF